jgi:hypothetical protein
MFFLNAATNLRYPKLHLQGQRMNGLDPASTGQFFAVLIIKGKPHVTLIPEYGLRARVHSTSVAPLKSLSNFLAMYDFTFRLSCALRFPRQITTRTAEVKMLFFMMFNFVASALHVALHRM